MSKVIITAIMVLMIVSGFAQNDFPVLHPSALVNDGFKDVAFNKPYTVVLYGGVGCGYSKFLIDNLSVLDECKEKCDVVLIMDQPADSIAKHLPLAVAQYPVYTNTVLGYSLKKKPNVFPQLLVFKGRKQVQHYVGIKKGMLTDTKERILKDE